MMTTSFLLLLATFTANCALPVLSYGIPSPLHWKSSVSHILDHLTSPPLRAAVPLEDLTNTRIPGPDGSELLAYVATPSKTETNDPSQAPPPTLILIHEFFGLSPSIVDKARGFAKDLGCVVVAPDTFRGTVTDFVPKAIWLALTTPQDRVNDDLDAVVAHVAAAGSSKTASRIAVMGFCYGGGKAIRYCVERRNDAAAVVCYGSPVTEVVDLSRLRAPVCGVYGRNDAQFSMELVDRFRRSLTDARVPNDVRVYDDVGHAFWTDMDQIRRGDQPQTDAYQQCIDFLRDFFDYEKNEK